MKQKSNQTKLMETYHEVGPYLGLGTQLAATIVIMFFLGRWLDSQFGTHPILTIMLAFFGGFAGVYNFIKTVLNMNKKQNND